MKEASICKPVVNYLISEKWDVYQEVTLPPGIADIVAVMNNRVWIVEAKTSISLHVISQADRWFKYSHWRSILVPRMPDRFVQEILKWKGIGCIVAGNDHISFPVSASINRHAIVNKVLKSLDEEHKSYAQAGSCNDRRWTPYLSTCSKILKYVSMHEGCTLKELIDNVPTHYISKSSAKQCIAHWASKNLVPNIEIRKVDAKLRLFIKSGD